MQPERDYESLLESVADGAEIDWGALEASAATSAERTRYRNLRLVARVAALHRTLVLDDEVSSPLSLVNESTSGDPDAWGHLTIKSRIASGAFGRIYRAHDSQLNRDVALKLLRGDITLLRPVERVLAEARTLARVHHPNVVTVHGADVRDGRAGLWMELVEGQTLDAWVSAHGTMGAREAAAIGIDLCRALAAVHGAGLVHGDVKAQNVMRETGGRIVLMDFGAGRAQGADAAGVAGTPMYLAPEVLAGEPTTVASDLYSLGVLLFYLLTRTYPYKGADIDGLRAAHADGHRDWLRDLRPDVPSELVHTIERALEPDPARRYATAGAMERDLAEEPRVAEPRDATQRARGSQRARLAFALTAVLLACVIAGLVIWSRSMVSTRGTVLTGIKTIGVLPIVDPTGSTLPADATNGLTEELISAIGQVHALTVKSAASLGTVDGKSDKEIARLLDVDALLRTSIGSGPGTGGNAHLKARARLVAAGTQGIVWAHEFDRERGDSNGLANAIAAAVTSAVNAAITPAESARLKSGHQTNASAEAAYLSGRAHLDQYGAADADAARKAFERALEFDSQYAAAHAGAARAYVSLGLNEKISNSQARADALREAREAIALDDNLAEAHAAMAQILFLYDWDWQGAEREFLRSLDLNANSLYALANYANFLAARARFDESLAKAEAARQLDPQSGAAIRNYALFAYYKGDFASAERALQESSEIEANHAGLPLLRGRLAEARGDFPRALAETREALRLSRGGGVPLRVQEISLLALTGRSDEAAAALSALQRDAAAGISRISARDLAYIALASGDRAKALALFDEAVTDRDPSVVWLSVDPRVDELRDDVHFRRLLQTIGVPDRRAEAR
jgi:eukaryotic-like serine/threonine-protein kinase